MSEKFFSEVSALLFGVWFLIGAALVFWMQAGFAPASVTVPSTSAPALRAANTPKLTKVAMVFSQERLEALKSAMNEIGVTGMTVTQVLGYGALQGEE